MARSDWNDRNDDRYGIDRYPHDRDLNRNRLRDEWSSWSGSADRGRDDRFSEDDRFGPHLDRPTREVWEGRNYSPRATESWGPSRDSTMSAELLDEDRYAYGSTYRPGEMLRSDSRPRESYRGRGPKNYQRSDERIREMVCERLEDHHEIDASEIEVTVANGDVTLAGSVDDRHTKRLAEDVAESVPGVKNVANTLRVEHLRTDVAHDVYSMMKDEVHHLDRAADTARAGITPTTTEESTPQGRNR